MDAAASIIYGFKIYSEGEYDEDAPENAEELKDKAQDAATALNKEDFIDVFQVGYCDGQAVYFLGFRKAWVYDYGNEPIDPEMFDPIKTNKMYWELKEFCEKNEIPFTKPQWHICAEYG